MKLKIEIFMNEKRPSDKRIRWPDFNAENFLSCYNDKSLFP